MSDEHRQRWRAMRLAFDDIAPPPTLEHRLRRSMMRSSPARPSRGRGRLFWVGATAAVLGVGLGWWLRPAMQAPTQASPTARAEPASDDNLAVPSSPRPRPTDAVSEARTCAVNPDAAGALNLPAGCTLTLREVGVTVDAWESTSVVPTPTGLRMQSGLAAFAVDRVAPGRPPVEIDVGATRVRVLGTRFVITNDDHGGHLDLIEGAVVLVRPSGLSEVEVGQRASWQHRAPEAAVPEPPSAPQLTAPSRTAPSRSAPSRSAPSSDDATRGALGDVLAELAQLRRRQRYVEALTVLDGFPRTSLDARTRAVLSYERGTLLEAAGRDDDACAHWAAHTARFVGVGPADAAQRRARLECPED